MAHYAFLDENNIVVKVLTGVNEDDTSTLPNEYNSWEEWYSNAQGLTCKRTSYNTVQGRHLLNGVPFRGNFASIGMVYNAEQDVFIQQQPYNSWILNTSIWEWEAPVPQPMLTEDEITNQKIYQWNESIVNWELTDIL